MAAKGTADTSLVKQPHAQFEYDTETLREFQKCCDVHDGAMYTSWKTSCVFSILSKVLYSFKPFPYQLETYRKNYNKYRYSINMLGRQMGKTTVAAGYLLWYAMFKPDSTILVASKQRRKTQVRS